MVIVNGSASPYCVSSPPEHTVLHKLWFGSTCPPMQDLLSLVLSMHFLQPAEVWYHTTQQVPSLRTCKGFNKLPGVKQIAADETSFNKRAAMLIHRSDAYRVRMLRTHGGWFLDGDAFMVSRRAARYARCGSWVLSTEHHTDASRADGFLDVEESRYLRKLNSGCMFAPQSGGAEFGRDWEHYLYTGSLRSGNNGWDYASCVWPTEYMTRYPERVIGAVDMRTVPFTRFPWATNRTWGWHVQHMIESGVTLIHFTAWKKKARAAQRREVVRSLLEHLDGDSSVKPSLHPAVRVLHAWLNDVKDDLSGSHAYTHATLGAPAARGKPGKGQRG